MRRRKSSNGYVLVWLATVIVGLVALGIGLLQLSRAEGIQVVREVRYFKALNLAEAGIERALWKIRSEVTPAIWAEGYSNAALADGAYSVSVTPTGVSNTFLLDSTGSVASASKKVSARILAWPPSGMPHAFDYAIFWGNTGGAVTALTLANNSTLQGSLFANGQINVENNATCSDGYIFATGGIVGTGDFVQGPVPQPQPMPVMFDTLPYDTYINTAQAQPAGDWVLDLNQTYYLTGTKYVNGNVTIRNNCNVYGPGKIVATGNISVLNNSHIYDSVDVICAGTVLINNNGSSIEGDGNTIYGGAGITVANNASVKQTFLLSPGTVSIYQNDYIEGVIWAGTVRLENNAYVKGAIYGDQFYQSEVANNFYVEYDRTLLDRLDLPEGTPPPDPETVVVVLSWTEAPAASF